MMLSEFLMTRIAEDDAAVLTILAWPEKVRGLPGIWEKRHAEYEAKRRIVEMHVQVPVPLIASVCPNCRAEHEVRRDFTHCAECGSDCYLEMTVGPLLALPYADHPDYREEWKP